MTTISILDTTTGETRSYRDSWYNSNPWEDSHEFLWSDGNYGCDCNRALFFARAHGEPDPGIECGESRFKVRITDDAGKVLYADGDWAGLE